MSHWLHLKSAAAISLFLLAQACSKDNDTISLIRSGSERACSSDEVKQSLMELVKADPKLVEIRGPGEPYLTEAAKKMIYNLDLIVLQGVQKDIAKVSCSGSLTIKSDEAASFSTREPLNLTYSVQPSAEDTSKFIISVDDGARAKAIASEILLQAALQLPQTPAAPPPAQTAATAPEEVGVVSDYGVAAGFDCGKASSATETLICGSPVLKAYDRAISVAYKQALQGSKSTATRDAQRTWIAARDKCGAAACLEESYNSRLSDLMSDASGLPTFKSKDNDGTLVLVPLDETTYAFSISALWEGQREGNVNTGEATGLLKLSGGKATYKDNDGCALNFQTQDRRNWIVKEGEGCTWGLNVTMNGSYH